MPVAHPPEITYSCDPYTHVFVLTLANGTPWNVTGLTFSVRVLDDEFGSYIPGHNATATVIDGPNGRVKVVVPQAFIAQQLGTESSLRIWVRLRCDTLEQTLIGVPVEIRP